MEIRPIHTKADYKAALREVSAYFDNEPEPGTPDGDRFEVLLTLVEAYEAKQFPIDLPDPVGHRARQVRVNPAIQHRVGRLEPQQVPVRAGVAPCAARQRCQA